MSPEQLEKLLSELPNPAGSSRVAGSLARTFFWKAYGVWVAAIVGVVVVAGGAYYATNTEPGEIPVESEPAVEEDTVVEGTTVSPRESVPGEGPVIEQPPVTDDEEVDEENDTSDDDEPSDEPDDTPDDTTEPRDQEDPAKDPANDEENTEPDDETARELEDIYKRLEEQERTDNPVSAEQQSGSDLYVGT